MSDMQPTPEGGASVTERLERYLAAGEAQQTKPEAKEQENDDSGQQAAPESTESAVEEPASDEPSEEDGPQYSLADVAKVLGVDESFLDVDEDGSLKVKTKIDGKEGAAKFADLVKSYQLQGHVDAKVRQAAETEKAIAERVKQIESWAQAGMQRMDALANAANHVLMSEFAGVNWDALVRDDPIAYQEKRHQWETRSAQVNQFLQSVEAQRNEFQQAYQWKQQQTAQRELSRLASLVPEWTDDKVRESERVELAQWLHKKGASEETINSLWDAGLVAALRAGMVAERNAPKVAAVEKKVRAAPKLVKPGQSTTATDKQAANLKALRAKIRESGGKSGVAEYLIAAGKV